MRKIICIILYFTYSGAIALDCKPQLNLGDTISFCTGNSITINASFPNTSYQWNNGSVHSSITVSSSGLYWVDATNSCGTSRDSVYVSVDQPVNLNLGPDIRICKGAFYTIQPPMIAGADYLWQDGSTGKTFTVTKTGTYHLKITNACGSFRDTIRIMEDSIPVLDLAPFQNVCNTLPVKIGVKPEQGTVNWNSGQQGDSIIVNQSGTYIVQVTNACGTFTDSITVNFSPGSSLNLKDTYLLCPSSNIILSSGINSGNHLWNNGFTSNTITVNQAGTYWVKYQDDCGTFYDTTEVLAVNKETLDLGRDTTLCFGNSLQLFTSIPSSEYLWNTGSTTEAITVATGGKYWLKVNTSCGYITDTIQVNFHPTPNRNYLNTNAANCYGTTKLLDAGLWGPNTTYLWDDGTTARNMLINSPGTRWVYVSNSCGSDTITFSVSQSNITSINLGRDDTVCQENIWIDITNQVDVNDTILWSGGITSPVAQIKTSGKHWVKVSNACGTFTDTVNYLFLEPPVKIEAVNNSICAGGSMILKVSSQPATHYLWSTGARTSSISITQAGTYWLQSSNKCATLTDTIVVSQVNPIQVNLGPDITLCHGQSKTHDVSHINADSVYWSNGSNSNSINISKSGAYWVQLFNACGEFGDTVNINFRSKPIPKLNDGAFCAGSSLTLNAGQSDNSTYLWNTGATTSSISVTEGGWYYVDISNDCGSIRDSAYIIKEQLIPKPDLGNDTVFCDGQILLQSPQIEGVSYEWQDGNTSSQLLVTRSGTYYVKLQNSCNTVFDTIIVLITGAPRETLGDVVKFCRGNTLTLNAQNPGSSYKWSNGFTEPVLSIDSGGTYWVRITNNCGVYTDSVKAIVEYNLKDLNIGPDTIICKGDDFYLKTNYPGLNNRWQNGNGLDSIKIEESGIYWLRAKNSCGSWYDSAFVEVKDIPEFSLGADTGICMENGSLTLSGPPDMKNYLWNTGHTSPELEITAPGTYWLEVSNACFSFSDTLEVYPEEPLKPDLGRDTILCYGETLDLEPETQGVPYWWDDGSLEKVRQITEGGKYWIKTRNSCGNFYDSINVVFDVPVDESPFDTTVCASDPAMFNLSGIKYDYQWFDGRRDSVRSFTQPGTYPVIIFNKCGLYQRDYIVKTNNCNCPFYVPNSFTPNGDGANDVFKIGHSCPLKNYKMEIYSRWGDLVFESDNLDEGWAGLDENGNPLPMAMYTYKIVIEWNVYSLDRHQRYFGTLALLR